MVIRNLEERDLAELLALYSHLHAEDPPPGRTVAETVWRELLANPRYRYYGLYVDEQLVSTCNLTLVPNLTRGCRPYGLIENVVTHSGHRRKGYGRALLRHGLEEAWAAGCYKVMLLTGRKDEATLRFYEDVGFDRRAKEAFLAKPRSGGEPLP
jgi:GNAT superfamily N-acetyltransferase